MMCMCDSFFFLVIIPYLKAEFLKTVAEKKDVQEAMHAISNVAATVLDSGDLR